MESDRRLSRRGCRRGWAPGLALAWVLAMPSLGLAHDFWLEPASYRPDVGEPLFLWLRVGDDFDGQKVARLDHRIERFWAVGPGETEARLVGLAGNDPAALLELASPGRFEVAYLGRPQPHELSAERFESYLHEEGLEAISRQRRIAGQSDRPGREQFHRCAKTILQVGPEPAEAGPRPLGLTLELVAESDPLRLTAGDALPVRLLFRGEPLAGALIAALPKGAPESRIASRTDDQGRVALVLDRPGPWLVKAVHMVAAPAGSEAEYQSWWASLTFELPESRDSGIGNDGPATPEVHR